jgi:hypothetical protein
MLNLHLTKWLCPTERKFNKEKQISHSPGTLPVLLSTWEAEIWRIKFEASPDPSSQDPSSKVTRAKWTGGVAQEVKHLFCKCKDLSSSPSPTKKNKNGNLSGCSYFHWQASVVNWNITQWDFSCVLNLPSVE